MHHQFVAADRIAVQAEQSVTRGRAGKDVSTALDEVGLLDHEQAVWLKHSPPFLQGGRCVPPGQMLQNMDDDHLVSRVVGQGNPPYVGLDVVMVFQAEGEVSV